MERRQRASWGGCTAPGNTEGLTQGLVATIIDFHQLRAISAHGSTRNLSSRFAPGLHRAG